MQRQSQKLSYEGRARMPVGYRYRDEWPWDRQQQTSKQELCSAVLSGGVGTAPHLWNAKLEQCCTAVPAEARWASTAETISSWPSFIAHQEPHTRKKTLGSRVNNSCNTTQLCKDEWWVIDERRAASRIGSRRQVRHHILEARVGRTTVYGGEHLRNAAPAPPLHICTARPRKPRKHPSHLPLPFSSLPPLLLFLFLSSTAPPTIPLYPNHLLLQHPNQICFCICSSPPLPPPPTIWQRQQQQQQSCTTFTKSITASLSKWLVSWWRD